MSFVKQHRREGAARGGDVRGIVAGGDTLEVVDLRGGARDGACVQLGQGLSYSEHRPNLIVRGRIRKEACAVVNRSFFFPSPMAFLFQKFQEVVKTLAKSPTFARDPRQLQFEVDINRLFLYTSYNRLGKNADEADAEEIIEMANKASVADQQMQVQENIHSQIKAFCTFMDELLLPNKMVNDSFDSTKGRCDPPTNYPVVPKQRPLSQAEVSQKLKDQLGYTLNVKPSQISHKDAGQGLFLDGVVDVGAVLAFYPGVVYTPAYYNNIPGYLNEKNPYLITRYDGSVIDAQPWGCGGYGLELWNGRKMVENKPDMEGAEKVSDSLSKPLEGSQADNNDDVLERRNPLALAHFANHPAKGMLPNVMICPYDFPLTENNMRVYIPNISFGNADASMRRFGSYWFKAGVSRNSESHVPTLKTIVLVATRALQDEELLLNYKLSNSKPWPEWYAPVDEEEDMRRFEFHFVKVDESKEEGVREIQYPPLLIMDVVMKDVGGEEKGLRWLCGVGAEAGDEEMEVLLGGGVTLIGRNLRFEKTLPRAFVEHFLKQEWRLLVIHPHRSRNYKCKLLLRDRNEFECHLAMGCYQFVKNKGLKTGDRVVFETRRPKVTIVRCQPGDNGRRGRGGR
ncbi:DNA-binding barrel domain superfamily [Sesbania bispinosa]|nr:DNA-binding barrel domain superfamily [Sesbania bispinosa]